MSVDAVAGDRDGARPLLPQKRSRKHVAVVVLGDLGRSPRMQYHALSLLREGHLVTLVGYDGEGLIPDLDVEKWAETEEESGPTEEKEGATPFGGGGGGGSSSRLNVLRLRPPSPPRSLRRGPLILLYLALRLCGLMYSLFRALWFDLPRRRSAPLDCILVQNPPSAPLLLVSWLYCATRRRRTRRPGLVIDWHNLGYTMFDLPDSHPVRRVARWYERTMAPRADGHLCVTSAMKSWLADNFGVRPGIGRGGENCAVLHDRPPSFFKPTGLEVRHELMGRLNGTLRRKCPDLCRELGCNGDEESGRERTIHTERMSDGRIQMRSDRPALVISSTSWTPDEDFSVLLEACVKLDEVARQRNDSYRQSNSDDKGKDRHRFPHVLVAVTGKGPQKAMYEERISKLRLQYVHIVTLWLESVDYPLLLGCADLGVSLHASTSGLDLPMKVYDMFGCIVPVCALDFDCLNELVRDGENGRVFSTSTQLAGQMTDMLESLGGSSSLEGGQLAELKEGVKGMTRWDENWSENARGVILRACPDISDRV
mmetsp:Transcript_39245/g.118029  ORF Transcript_39245/g.118029 Transcript_39245/m.118029 type:complete len:540 (-) Transcript_39245:335-1954(-)